jgi:hypothetical protein
MGTVTLDEVRAAIAASGAGWTAGPTDRLALPASDGLPPSGVDWRATANLTPARDQGEGTCTCTSFAICATMQDLYAIGHPRDLPLGLSPGHLHVCVCDRNLDQPADLRLALDKLGEKFVAAGGPADGPWDGERCETITSGYTISGYRLLDRADADAVKQALVQGPVVAEMILWHDFKFYKGGIYRPVAGPDAGVHTVELVGYQDVPGYWILKNSSGPGWGIGGFALVAYGACGIAEEKRAFALDGVLPSPAN